MQYITYQGKSGAICCLVALKKSFDAKEKKGGEVKCFLIMRLFETA